MKTPLGKNHSLDARRRMIIETIDAAIQLSEKIGGHSLTKGCNCISCIYRRKRLLENKAKEWKFKL